MVNRCQRPHFPELLLLMPTTWLIWIGRMVSSVFCFVVFFLLLFTEIVFSFLPSLRVCDSTAYNVKRRKEVLFRMSSIAHVHFYCFLPLQDSVISRWHYAIFAKTLSRFFFQFQNIISSTWISSVINGKEEKEKKSIKIHQFC